MHGLILIDKSAGMSSHDVVRRIRRLFKTRKVGHAGTLDPMATGVLPIAIGDGTKILQFLLNDEKSYRARLQFGVTTDTYDSDGQVLLRRHVPAMDMAALELLCQQFRGEIMQIPPMYSALKKDGVPLYKLARRGETVDREARQVNITRLELIELEGDSLTIEVDCSKGTYIRSLIYDIGEKFGCGAHMTALQRTVSAGFALSECYTLEALEALEDPQQKLISVEEAVRAYPQVEITAEAAQRLHCGVPPVAAEALELEGLSDAQLVRLCYQGKLMAMVRYAPQRLKEKRGDFELVRVFVAQ
jgi:tRNA pseudouridine55 synthase